MHPQLVPQNPLSAAQSAAHQANLAQFIQPPQSASCSGSSSLSQSYQLPLQFQKTSSHEQQQQKPATHSNRINNLANYNSAQQYASTIQNQHYSKENQNNEFENQGHLRRQSQNNFPIAHQNLHQQKEIQHYKEQALRGVYQETTLKEGQNQLMSSNSQAWSQQQEIIQRTRSPRLSQNANGFKLVSHDDPSSECDIKISSQLLREENLRILSQNAQINQPIAGHRNPSQTLTPQIFLGGFKSHQIQSDVSKNQMTAASTFLPTNGTAESIGQVPHTFKTIQDSNSVFYKNNNNHTLDSAQTQIQKQKRQSLGNSGQQLFSSGLREERNEGSKGLSAAHTANSSKEPHKKSQSLYNKKIVEIISGLQQSLGVIASNVQTNFVPTSIQQSQVASSYNSNSHPAISQLTENGSLSFNQLKGEQQKALFESALLAQKIAQMTQGMKKDSLRASNGSLAGLAQHLSQGVQKQKETKATQPERASSKTSALNAQSQKRKSMKVTSNLSGRGSLNLVQKNHKQHAKEEGDKNQRAKRLSTSNRMSLDLQQQQKKSIVHHQRNRSDLQNPRKNIVTTLQNPGASSQFVQSYQQQKQNTFLTCSNSSIDAMSGFSLQQQQNPYPNSNLNIMVGEDVDILEPTTHIQQPGNLPSSVKSLNSYNQHHLDKFQGGSKQMSEFISNSVDNNSGAMSAVLAAKYHSAVQSNYHDSRHNSIVHTTLDNPKQKSSVAGNRRLTCNFTSGDRLSSSDANTFLSSHLQHQVNQGDQPAETMHAQEQQNKLKSVASSPTLHSLTQIKNSYIQNLPHPVTSLVPSSANQVTKKNGNYKQEQLNQAQSIFNFSNSNLNPSSQQSSSQTSKILSQNLEGNAPSQTSKHLVATAFFQGAKQKPLNTKKQKNLLTTQSSQPVTSSNNLGGFRGNDKKSAVTSSNSSSQAHSALNSHSQQSAQTLGQHKRSTSDGSSLNKMFHFKQQMLINKIFKQQNSNQQQDSNHSHKTQVLPSKTHDAKQQSKKIKKEKKVSGVAEKENVVMRQNAFLLSSLSSKRQSSEDNQENQRINFNYQTLRETNSQNFNGQNLKQGKLEGGVNFKAGKQSVGEGGGKLSQEMRSILNKFKTRDSCSESLVSQIHKQQTLDSQHLEHKQKLIQAITNQQQAFTSLGGKQQPESEENSYLMMNQFQGSSSHLDFNNGHCSASGSHLSSNHKLYGQADELRIFKNSGGYSDSNYQTAKVSLERSGKRQQEKILNAHQVIQSHKRAKSDANKNQAQQQKGQDYCYSSNYLSKAQQLIDQANQSRKAAQKMFFHNLIQDQPLPQPATGLNNSAQVAQRAFQVYDQHMPTSFGIAQQIPYSARASPTVKSSIASAYYLTSEDYNLNLGAQLQPSSALSKPLIATARSETSTTKINSKQVKGTQQLKQTQNTLSNQTTLKKTNEFQPANSRVSAGVNTRLVYPEATLLQNDIQIIDQQRQMPGGVLHSQQFSKISHILYGDTPNQQPLHQSAQTQHRVLSSQPPQFKAQPGEKQDQRLDSRPVKGHKRIESAVNFANSHTEDLRYQEPKQQAAKNNQLQAQRLSSGFQGQQVFEYNQQQNPQASSTTNSYSQLNKQKQASKNNQRQNFVNLEIDLDSGDSNEGNYHKFNAQAAIKSLNQSPRLKMMPTPKLNQPGGAQQVIQSFYQGHLTPSGLQEKAPQMIVNANFMISPVLQQQQQKLMQQAQSGSDCLVVQTEQDDDLEGGDPKEEQRLISEESEAYGEGFVQEAKQYYGKSNQEAPLSSHSKQPVLFANSEYLKQLKKAEKEEELYQQLKNSKHPPAHKEQDLEGGHQFTTFESNLTTHTFNNLSPRSREKYKIIKQIKGAFQKQQEPPKTTPDYYRIGKMLGKGAFGRVNLAIHKLCCQLVAVKSISKQFLSEDESSKQKLVQEMQILQQTRHENVVRLYDSFETNKQLVFVMELCAGGDLLNYVRKRRKLKEPVARYVFKQVAEGLHYCHRKGIVHRDMKLDNLLFDEQGVVKICDFGVSRQLTSAQERMTEQCGTPAYIAPEILKDKGYRGFGVDVWSLGVCLFAMLFGTVPFKANNMSELHQLIMKAKFTFKEGDLKPGEVPLSEDVKALIKAILEPNPEKRITMEGILNHRWLQEQPEQPKIEIFTEQELETIRRDFTYQDMSRYKRNLLKKKKLLQQQIRQQMTQEVEQSHNPLGLPASAIVPGYNGQGAGAAVTTEENLFTEHALDSTQNVLMRNCSTKSVILAPFNSTRTHIAREDLDQDLRPFGSQDNGDQEDSTYLPPLPIDPAMMVDKKVIRYAPRVKDINRQYEMNNNCELDNGVYNKFVKQSTDKAGEEEEDHLRSGCTDKSKSPQEPDKSLILTMNGDCQENLLEQEEQLRHRARPEAASQQYAAPLVSQASEVAELVAVQNKKLYPSNFLQSNLKKPVGGVESEDANVFKGQVQEAVAIDKEVVEKVTHFGYPREYVLRSLEKFELNDATANYYLLEKEKLVIEDLQNNLRFYQ